MEELGQSVMEQSGFGSGGGLVLVVDDDPEVGGAISDALRARGCRALAVDDYEPALDLCGRAAPAVIVLDQIAPTPEGEAFLAALEERGAAAVVVLLRYRPGPAGSFRNLRVTVVAGERWFEDLPEVVGRYAGARAS